MILFLLDESCDEPMNSHLPARVHPPSDPLLRTLNTYTDKTRKIERERGGEERKRKPSINEIYF